MHRKNQLKEIEISEESTLNNKVKKEKKVNEEEKAKKYLKKLEQEKKKLEKEVKKKEKLSKKSAKSTAESVKIIKLSTDEKKVNLWDKFKFTDLIDVKKFQVDNLPKGIRVSTICSSCHLGCELDLDKIQKYLPLDSDTILSVKKTKTDLRTILTPPEILDNEEKRIKSFQNSITIVMRKSSGFTTDLDNESKINMKLFKNGSVQMSGCKDLMAVNIVLNKLIFVLKQKYQIKESKKEISFVENPDLLKITNFKIDMINANYKVNVTVNREKLFNLLLKKKIKTSYEPCTRACVIIKYNSKPEEKDISIFVFEKGNIIITGAKSKESVKDAYTFINSILVTHQEEVDKKVDVDLVIKQSKYRDLICDI